MQLQQFHVRVFSYLQQLNISRSRLRQSDSKSLEASQWLIACSQDAEAAVAAKFNAARKLRNPESRLRAFLDLCAGKKHDDSTGGPQPAYRVETGMKITAEFPKDRDADDDMQDQAERKQASIETSDCSVQLLK